MLPPGQGDAAENVAMVKTSQMPSADVNPASSQGSRFPSLAMPVGRIRDGEELAAASLFYDSPQLDGSIRAARGQGFAIRAESHRPHATVMSF